MIKDDFRPSDAKVPPFGAPYAPPDEDIAAAFLQTAPLPPEAEARIDARAGALVGAIRAHAGGLGGVEDFLREYSLSTRRALPSWFWPRPCCGCRIRRPQTASSRTSCRRAISARTRCAPTRSWFPPRPGRLAFRRGSSAATKRRKASCTSL